jgi:hypothetical protein
VCSSINSYRGWRMEGWRKVAVAAVALVFETGVFIFSVFWTKQVDTGMLTAYFAAVAGTVAVFSAANVVSKAVGPEPPKTP